MTAVTAPPPPRRIPLWGPLAGRLVYRNVLVGRRAWLLIVSGFAEPELFLLGIGIGVGSLSATYLPGRACPYKEFVAPAMLAAAAMNGAIYESTITTSRSSSGSRPTTRSSRRRSRSAMSRSASSPTRSCAEACTPAGSSSSCSRWGSSGLVGRPRDAAAILVGAAFAAVGLIGVTFMRSWADFALIELVTLPLFLFSATFVPLDEYPPAAQWMSR